MKSLKFVHGKEKVTRSLDIATLASLGIERETGFEWSSSNDHTVEVSNENAEILLERIPGEFVVVEEKPVEEESPPVADIPVGSPEEVDTEPTETVETVETEEPADEKSEEPPAKGSRKKK